MENFFFNIFEHIDFLNRYKKLSEITRENENRLEKTEKSKVLEILKRNDVDAKFISKGQFYKIEDILTSWNLTLHLSIKYGVVEVIFGAKNINSGLVIGGPASIICEAIEIQKGHLSNDYVKKPSFSNYEVLTKIIEEILSLYKSFKNELVKGSF